MRLTTKVWVVLSVLTLLAVAGRTVVAVDREVVQRIDDPRQFNETVYTAAGAGEGYERRLRMRFGHRSPTYRFRASAFEANPQESK